jgi:hypothetical protein
MASFVMIGSCSRCGSLWGTLLSPESSGSAVFTGGGARDTEAIAEDSSGGSVGLTSLMMVDVMVGRTAVESVDPVIWGCGASFPEDGLPKVKEGTAVAELLFSDKEVGIDIAAVEVAPAAEVAPTVEVTLRVEVASRVAVDAAVAPLSTGDGGSASSSDSESSLSDMSPTVDGLLNGESGLSGPSSSSASAAGIVLATGST